MFAKRDLRLIHSLRVLEGAECTKIMAGQEWKGGLAKVIAESPQVSEDVRSVSAGVTAVVAGRWHIGPATEWPVTPN
jgi:hypothetical protein